MTMPWLTLDAKTNAQQAQLSKILDTMQAKVELKRHLEKLYQLQNGDGGLAWFDGGQSNAYISNYVLAGFGKIWKDSWKTGLDGKLTTFIDRLIGYADTQFDAERPPIGILRYFVPDDLYYIYGRSFWSDKKVSTNLLPKTALKIKKVLGEKWEIADRIHLSKQAMLIIATMRYFDPSDKEYQKALDLLKSIRQLAIEDPYNGLRWKDIADADDLNRSTEETMALLAEAFAEPKTAEHIAAAEKVYAGITKWLLQAKSGHNWQTTKGTAAAIDLLKKDRGSIISAPQSIVALVEGKPLRVSDDMLSGTPLQFIRTGAKPASLTFSKQSTDPAIGSVSYHYFTSTANLEGLNREISLRKKLYRFVGEWKEVPSGSPLKIGERIKVVLSIQTPKALQYVTIEDKRGAAFEPRDRISGRQIQQGMSYYLSIRDIGIQLFTEFIPSGRSEISYELNVVREGVFESGLAVLQGMYQPVMTAYSNNWRITVEKE